MRHPRAPSRGCSGHLCAPSQLPSQARHVPRHLAHQGPNNVDWYARFLTAATKAYAEAILFGFGQGNPTILFGFGQVVSASLFGFGQGVSAILFGFGQGDSTVLFGFGLPFEFGHPIRIRPDFGKDRRRFKREYDEFKLAAVAFPHATSPS